MTESSVIGAPAGKNVSSRLGLWLSIAFLIILPDQLRKIYFDRAFDYGERLNVLPFFDLTLLYNEEGWQRWFFTALGIGAAILIIGLLRRAKGQTRFSFALSMILGGALRNVVDHAVYGHVVDLLLFYWNDWHFPAFNLANIGISCGAILLILDEILRSRKRAG